MIENNSKCFIIDKDGKYEEITYEELKKRREVFESYRYRHFIPLHGMLMEVREDDYYEFYKDMNRYRYYEKLERFFNVLCLQSLSVRA